MSRDPDIADSKQSVVVVTGGAGFIGSHVTDAVVQQGDRVHVLDNLTTGNVANLNPAAEFHEIDICDSSLRSLISEINPDLIYHLAAQGSVSVSAKDPELDAKVNIMGTLNLLNGACSLSPIPKMVYFSTGGAIYGEIKDDGLLPVNESMVPRPSSPYGASKLAVENYLPVYADLYGLDYVIVRPANIYGPRQDPHGEAGVIAIFTKAMLEKRDVTIFGDGSYKRDYLYVSDFVDAMLAVAERNGKGPYNISSGHGVSVNELFRLLSALTRYESEPIHAAIRLGDIPKIWLDATRAKDELDWVTGTSLEDGMKMTVDWFRGE